MIDLKERNEEILLLVFFSSGFESFVELNDI